MTEKGNSFLFGLLSSTFFGYLLSTGRPRARSQMCAELRTATALPLHPAPPDTFLAL